MMTMASLMGVLCIAPYAGRGLRRTAAQLHAAGPSRQRNIVDTGADEASYSTRKRADLQGRQVCAAKWIGQSRQVHAKARRHGGVAVGEADGMLVTHTTIFISSRAFSQRIAWVLMSAYVGRRDWLEPAASASLWAW